MSISAGGRRGSENNSFSQLYLRTTSALLSSVRWLQRHVARPPSLRACALGGAQVRRFASSLPSLLTQHVLLRTLILPIFPMCRWCIIINSLAQSNQGVCVVFSVDTGFADVWVIKPTAQSSSARGDSGPLSEAGLATTGAWLWWCWACWRASSRVALSLSTSSLRNETQAPAGSVSDVAGTFTSRCAS